MVLTLNGMAQQSAESFFEPAVSCVLHVMLQGMSPRSRFGWRVMALRLVCRAVWLHLHDTVDCHENGGVFRRFAD